jgi:hypothetical protein
MGYTVPVTQSSTYALHLAARRLAFQGHWVVRKSDWIELYQISRLL